MNLYPFGKAVTYALVRLLFRMRYEGIENIPQDRGFILASNHRTNFDPLFIAHKVPKQLFYMAKVELFRNGLIGWLLRSLGAFPVERGKGDTRPMERAKSLLDSGGVLGMFPEGHRSKDGTPLRPRSGVALIAGQTGADVLPCAVVYGKKLGFRTVVTVRYGKVMAAGELGIDPASPSTVRSGARVIMDAIVALLEKGGDPPCP